MKTVIINNKIGV